MTIHLSQQDANKEVREAMQKKHLVVWQFADLMGVSEQTAYRWLRHELPEAKKKKILEKIEAIQFESEEELL